MCMVSLQAMGPKVCQMTCSIMAFVTDKSGSCNAVMIVTCHLCQAHWIHEALSLFTVNAPGSGLNVIINWLNLFLLSTVILRTYRLGKQNLE